MRFAFTFIAVEQRARGDAAQNEIKLPAQIDRITKGRAPALTHKGRHGMGRVSSKKHVARAPLLRQPTFEYMYCLTEDGDVVIGQIIGFVQVSICDSW